MRKDGGGDRGRNWNPGMILLRGTARLSGHHVLPDPLLWTWCYRPPAVDLVLPGPLLWTWCSTLMIYIPFRGCSGG